MTTRRIVSIWLPRFPIARWERLQARLPDQPCAPPWEEAESGPDTEASLVLSAPGTHGPVVHACNAVATANGAGRGMRVTDLRALCPEVQVVPADLSGDAEALRRLTLWSRRWCPWSASDGADGLVLDTTGSDHLWGGETAMLADIEARLADLGQTARLAVAPTHGAAWALARYGDAREICGGSALRVRLAMLPIAALRLDAATLLTLRRLGIKRIGDLMVIPRAALERRFGRDGRALMTPLRRLDQMTGALPEPIVSPPPPQRFRVVQRLVEPVMDPQPLLPEPMRMLCTELATAGQGMRGLRLELYRTDGMAVRFEVSCAQASRDATHLIHLLARHFENLDAGFGFDTLSLEALRPEALSAAQVRLDGGVQSDVALATLIDRLTVRLGPQAVQLPDPVPSHLPERAERWAPATARADLLAPGGLGGGGMIAPRRDRPLRLLHNPERIEVLYAVPEGPPVRFKWRCKPYLIRRHQGPERIAPEWWRARPGTRLRDYYKVEVEEGARYWLFREGLLGDGRGDNPDWFLHGLFA